MANDPRPNRNDDTPDADAERTPGDSTPVDDFDRDTPAALGLPEPLQDVLKVLSSLKLTIVLLGMGIFVVLAGTFAQTKMGNWQAVDKYFRTGITFIEFDVFVPKAFFPDRSDDAYGIPLPGGSKILGFFFPGGWAIGTCMLINLLAAHALRFKIQAKGPRLTAGLVTLGVGMALAWLVIALGDDKEGMQVNMTPQLLNGLWYSFMGIIGLGVAGGVYGLVQLDRTERGMEWWTCALVAALLTGLLAFLYLGGEEVRLKPESMRILWQLVKASAGAGVLLAGCMMVFKKRAGVVLLHAGVGLLMLSEVMVGKYAEEGQMTIQEGETVNFAQDIRSVELAFVDESGENENVHIVIPESKLKRGEPIEVEGLPFVIRPVRDAKGNVEFMDNSALRRLTQKQADALADAKFTYKEAAEGYAVDPVAPTNGLESTVDTASVWVDLESPDGKTKHGRYLFSQHLRDQDVEVGDKTYSAALRFTRKYLPYSVHLVDIRKKDYVGTATPKDYSSYVDLYDAETELDRHDVRIYMNNPLRYRGQTLYQTDYKQSRKMIVDETTGRPVFGEDGKPTFENIEYTTLSVVTNRGWMLPYVCCMIIAFGMLYQFTVVLFRFLGRQRRQLVDAPVTDWTEYLPTAAALGIALLLTGYMARPATTKPGEPAIHEFGTLPVTSKGRVKPLDSLARNQLLIMSEREGFPLIVEEGPGTVLRNDIYVTKKSRPAIEWLLDTATNPKKSDTYPIFRITEPNLIDDLGLQQRPGFFRYSYKEIEPKIEFIRDRVREAQADGRTEEDWSFDQRKAIELYNHLQTYFAIQLAFRDVDSAGRIGQTPTEYLRFILLAGSDLDRIPYVTPTDDPEPKWGPYALGAAKMWLKDFARESRAFDDSRVTDAKNVVGGTEEGTPERRAAERALERARLDAIGERFVAAMKADGSYERHLEMTIENLVVVRMRDLLASMMRDADPRISAEEANTRAAAAMQNPPDRIKKQLDSMEQVVREEVSGSMRLVGMLADQDIVKQLARDIPEVLGDIDWAAPHPAEVTGMKKVLDAYRTASAHEKDGVYREDDLADFETAIAEYRKVVDGEDRFEYEPAKVRFEAWFNKFMPFFLGQYMTLPVLLLVLGSWLFLSRGLSRAAFCWMAYIFLLATFALCCRIYISGRPPVTNLYSSAVFIAWGGMLLGLILESVSKLGIGTAVAGMLGFLGLGIAQFLATDGDTIAVMQAVLDTNIWLATHVVCVTFGYAATFVAGVFALCYIHFGLRGAPFVFSMLFAVGALVAPLVWQQAISACLLVCSLTYGVTTEMGISKFKFDDKVAKLLTNMTYGTLCFAILFSFVGTVLGGLWADDSWGRFWGWDPKENGALIIVLWNALVLHARWDGIVKDRGLAILAVAGNITTLWSWFGTNELKAGLHSYGFTEGMLAALGTAAAVHLGIIVLTAVMPTSLWWHKQKPDTTTVA